MNEEAISSEIQHDRIEYDWYWQKPAPRLVVLIFPPFETSHTTPPKPDTIVVSFFPLHCFGKVKGVVKSYAAIVGAPDAKRKEEGMVRVRASSTLTSPTAHVQETPG